MGVPGVFSSDQQCLSFRDTMDSVKQSAALCLLRLYRTSPDLVPMGDWTSRVVHLLNDQHLVNAFGLASPLSPPSNRFWSRRCESSSVWRLTMPGGELPPTRGQASADMASGPLHHSSSEGPPTGSGCAGEQDRDPCLLEILCPGRAFHMVCLSGWGVEEGIL